MALDQMIEFMRAKIGILAAGFFMLVAILAGAPTSAGAQNSNGGVVYCYDEASDVVTNRTPSQCDGKIISEAEAAEVKKRRLAKMRGAFRGKAKEKAEAPGASLKNTGSGFFVTEDGKLVTNHHVVDGCQAISVLPTDLKRRKAKLISISKSFDFALLQVDSKPESIVTFRSPVERVSGKRIAVIGYPMNAAIARILPYFEQGETMKPRRPQPGFLALQFSADVRPGNSGGPLLDEAGFVIGVVTAKINTVSVAQKTGEIVTNIGYATDTAILFQFLNANGVSVTKKEHGKALADKQMFEAAKKFSARIECWR